MFYFILTVTEVHNKILIHFSVTTNTGQLKLTYLLVQNIVVASKNLIKYKILIR